MQRYARHEIRKMFSPAAARGIRDKFHVLKRSPGGAKSAPAESKVRQTLSRADIAEQKFAVAFYLRGDLKLHKYFISGLLLLLMFFSYCVWKSPTISFLAVQDSSIGSIVSL